MSLQEYNVLRDEFKADETLFGFSFPCNVCKFNSRSDKQEPCRYCDRNLNAVTDVIDKPITMYSMQVGQEDNIQPRLQELIELGRGQGHNPMINHGDRCVITYVREIDGAVCRAAYKYTDKWNMLCLMQTPCQPKNTPE